jgi:4-hydroxy-3-methylbut-2-enyl diphosphate reductase
MKVEVAKSAGFCFGVNRAIEIVNKLVDDKNKVATLGPIIHNPIVVAQLEEKGVRTVSSIDEVGEDEILVIRSHGVPESVIKELEEKNIKFVDATCPYVRKIHKIVSKDETTDKIIIGDKDHPEIVGIKGHAKGKSYVVRNLDELKKLTEKDNFLPENPKIFVAQTTFSIKDWEKSMDFVKKVYTNAEIFDTICRATEERQSETDSLSKKADAMIVIGGKNSSNTKKLYDTAKKNCADTYFVETAKDLPTDKLKGKEYIGITAGASTPVGIIKEVLKLCQNL